MNALEIRERYGVDAGEWDAYEVPCCECGSYHDPELMVRSIYGWFCEHCWEGAE